MSGFLLSPDGVRRNLHPVARRAPAARGWLDWLAVTLRVITTRRQLAEMDERMLKDIGISRCDALTEAARAPWDTGPRGM
ncbi:DUF1127 domain-containing protein [Roseomonas frigidaquae]|uniref:DUF1127 domain-containing protein n=1 Tax=Falsiroseomonas frigidaquae TaxID=487318 RepID=A0ABX1F8J5_9PROT|nr:DUF1127 domain-containing protein [Falsiroseomonas frigidaquae]NKE48692.1 DUF1127 domain-containing protein [Falsiroseomonas frigidaquae]